LQTYFEQVVALMKMQFQSISSLFCSAGCASGVGILSLFGTAACINDVVMNHLLGQ
jgi:hypothetical protein